MLFGVYVVHAHIGAPLQEYEYLWACHVGPGTTSGLLSSSILLEADCLDIYHCTCQERWPESFQGSFGFCISFHYRCLGIADKYCTQLYMGSWDPRPHACTATVYPLNHHLPRLCPLSHLSIPSLNEFHEYLTVQALWRVKSKSQLVLCTLDIPAFWKYAHTTIWRLSTR